MSTYTHARARAQVNTTTGTGTRTRTRPRTRTRTHTTSLYIGMHPQSRRYDDIKEQLGLHPSALLDHYRQTGSKEGRDPKCRDGDGPTLSDSASSDTGWRIANTHMRAHKHTHVYTRARACIHASCVRARHICTDTHACAHMCTCAHTHE